MNANFLTKEKLSEYKAMQLEIEMIKKEIKKTIGFSPIILIAPMLICSIVPLFADDPQTSTNSLYEFTLDSKKRAKITAYKGKETSVSIGYDLLKTRQP